MSSHNPDSRDTPPTATTSAPPGSGSPEPHPAAERLAYSVSEAARLTGLSRDLLYEEMRRENLTYIKVGRRRIITRQVAPGRCGPKVPTRVVAVWL